MIDDTPGTADVRVRALLVTMDHAPTRGGIQTMTREILGRAREVSYRVIAPADPGWRQSDAISPVPVRRVGSVAPGRRGYVPGIAAATWAEIRRHRPDVVLAMHALAAPAAVLSSVPTVVVAHGGELRSPRIRAVAKRVLTRADRLIANSAFTRAHAVALGADPLKVAVLPVGAPEPVKVGTSDAEALKQRLGGGRIVLSVARLEPHKGHDRLIRALPGAPGDVRMVLVGRGSARASLEALARDLDVTDRVVFADEVSDADLPRYYAAADCFALASRETTGPQAGAEGGGISLLEACAYGLPVIAANTGGIPETITDGETGLLVDPEDPATISRALHRVFDDPSMAARLAGAASQLARGERSWARFVERLEAIVTATATRGGARQT